MSLETPAQITFHQTSHSDALEADIRDKLDQLGALSKITAARVVVEHEHFDRADEGPVTVRFDLALPGGKTIVGTTTETDGFAAVRAAFEVTRRQIHNHLERRRAPKRSARAQSAALAK